MLRSIIVAFLTLLMVSACTSVKPPTVPTPSDITADTLFHQYSNVMLQEYWREFPDRAFQVGNFVYADKLRVPDEAARNRETDFYHRHLTKLGTFDPNTLSPENQVDLTILKNELESRRWRISVLKSWQWQPSEYDVGEEFARSFEIVYAPLDIQLRHILSKLQMVPAYYAAAKSNISRPTVEHVDLAQLQNKRTLEYVGVNLVDLLQESTLSADEKTLFESRLRRAKVAIADYMEFLGSFAGKNSTVPARSFRIGAALYDEKFKFDTQSSFSAQQLYLRAQSEKSKLHESMTKLAMDLWPKYLTNTVIPSDNLSMIRALIDELSKRHARPETFVDTIRMQVKQLEAFIRDKDLVEPGWMRRLVVRETPSYMRGPYADLSISIPGHLIGFRETYYNVPPLRSLSPVESEAFLRQNNFWALQIRNIHETIPGRYTQAFHSFSSKNIVKSLFRNNSMMKGWAAFSEKEMLNAGYGEHAPEMQLFWMKSNLRSALNVIIDFEMHTKNLERDTAIQFMQREGIQEEGEAAENWRRATLVPVELVANFDGYVETTELHEKYLEKFRNDYSIKVFNSKFLSFGSAPVRSIADLLLLSK